MTEDELPDWLSKFELDPADIARGDQATSEARRSAAQLFTHYFSFNWALDNGQHLAALGHNIKFQSAFSHLTQEQGMYVTAFLCELLCQELLAKYNNNMEEMISAAANGTMFAAARAHDKDFEILKNLESE
jgi:hypothetical protein